MRLGGVPWETRELCGGVGDNACAVLKSGTGRSTGHRKAWEESLAVYPGVNTAYM